MQSRYGIYGPAYELMESTPRERGRRDLAKRVDADHGEAREDFGMGRWCEAESNIDER